MESNVKKIIKLLELNRRNFIKLAIGGAAGIHLTPLPWKLMDDVAIWTQNWPWVPVPPVGEFFHETSVCTLCPGGCGIEVRKVDERAVKIEGRTDYPVNPGGICPMGAAGLQLLYNESIRYTGPMKRVGPRGSGKFINISWETAIKELADKIKKLRANGHPEALAAVDGNPGRSSTSLLIRRLLEAVGSPNYSRIPSVEDTYNMVNFLMQGTDGPMSYDLENADFILSFGCGLVEGWGSPGRVINAWNLWREDPPGMRKTKVVQIDCRASNTASKSDQWLAIRPGTEAALALGLAHVIIKEEFYDKNFINYSSFGFSDWHSDDGKKHMGFKTMVLKKYSPETVEKITGLNKDVIVSLAKVFAKGSKRPIALCGRGKGTLNGSLFEFMAIQGLNALVGSINRHGGVIVNNPMPLASWPDIQSDSISKEGLQKTRLDQTGPLQFPLSELSANNLTDAILKDSESPINTLLIFSANPVYTLPGGGRFKDALTKVPFIVSFSPYKDETTLMADLILPDHTCLEKMEDIVWPTGLQYPLYGLSKPVVDPLYDTAHCGNTIIRIAKEIGGTVGSSFPWKDFEASIKERAHGLFKSGSGLTGYEGAIPAWKSFISDRAASADFKSFDDLWKKLKSGGMWYLPTHDFKSGKGIFKTPTGKFEFFSTHIELAVKKLAKNGSLNSALETMGIGVTGDEAFMPHYEPAPSGVDKKKYPLLMMPYELINLSSNWLPNPHFLTKTLFDNQIKKDESFAEINPKTAQEYGLMNGDRALIQSDRGELRVRVNLFEGAMPGVLYLPIGLGHTAYDEYQQGRGVNPFEIINGDKDPLSGQPIWWNTRVRLKKV